MGPPGEAFKSSERKLRSDVSEWKKEWVMRTLFNNIIWELLFFSKLCKILE